jgi:hypothetical protein
LAEISRYRGRLRAAVAFSRRSSSRFNSGPDKVDAIFVFLPYSVDPRKRPLPTITALQNMLGMTLRAVNSPVYKALSIMTTVAKRSSMASNARGCLKKFAA